jgi:hypothetical protein
VDHGLRGGISRRLSGAVTLAVALVATGPVVFVQPPPVTDAALFDSAVLQRVDLQVSERDWDTLRERYTANTYYPASFVWRGQAVRNVGIRSRGSGTRSGVKPGLLVDFDRYVSGQTFLGLKALVLDNHLQDASAMREAVTMALLARIGVPAPREAHAELYVNGQFFGVYSLVENIDSVATKQMFAPPAVPAAPVDPVGSPARRARLRRPPPGSVDPPVMQPAPPPDRPTGYLFEYNWLDYYYETYLGFDLDRYVEILEAKTHEDEPLEALYRPVELMLREINQAPDGQFVERVGPHLDLPLYVRTVAVQVFMADWDGIAGDFGANNFYLYRDAAGGPHRFIPWDEDNAFHAIDYDIDAPQEKHVLLRRAMEVPELRRLFLDTLANVARIVETPAAGQTVGWLEQEIARRHALMAASHAQDRVRPYSDADVGGAVAFNLDFARRRPLIVRQQIEAALLRAHVAAIRRDD